MVAVPAYGTAEVAASIITTGHGKAHARCFISAAEPVSNQRLAAQIISSPISPKLSTSLIGFKEATQAVAPIIGKTLVRRHDLSVRPAVLFTVTA